MAELVTDDIVWEDPALPGAGARHRRRAGVHARGVGRVPRPAFDETDPPHLTVGGDEVAWRWRMRGTNTGRLDPPGFAPTGRAMAIEGVDLWTMRDGRIAATARSTT